MGWEERVGLVFLLLLFFGGMGMQGDGGCRRVEEGGLGEGLLNRSPCCCHPDGRPTFFFDHFLQNLFLYTAT